MIGGISFETSRRNRERQATPPLTSDNRPRAGVRMLFQGGVDGLVGRS